MHRGKCSKTQNIGERGGSVVECRTPEREVGGSRPTAAVLCLWARHFTPRKYWLITQEAVAPSRYDWKIVDWDVKPQHKQTKTQNAREAREIAFAAIFISQLICWMLHWKEKQTTFPSSNGVLLQQREQEPLVCYSKRYRLRWPSV